MNTASILIKTDPKVKEAAQKTAEELGLSLSSVLNQLLKQFVKTKTITFNAKGELTPYAKKEIKKAMDDLKAGKASPIFSNAKESIEWLEKQGI